MRDGKARTPILYPLVDDGRLYYFSYVHDSNPLDVRHGRAEMLRLRFAPLSMTGDDVPVVMLSEAKHLIPLYCRVLSY